MNQIKPIKYREYKIGKFESPNTIYKANVIYIDSFKMHVTVWDNNRKIRSELMTKSKWEIVRNVYDLVMVDIQDVEMPIMNNDEDFK